MERNKDLLVKLGSLLKGNKGEEIQKDLENLVAKHSPVLKAVWMTVKLGTYKNGQRLLGALQALGFLFGAWAEKLLSSPEFPVSLNEIEVDLVELSVGSDLGFKDGNLWSKILERIVELGYEVCPAEVGPLLRMEHGKGELRWVAMQPMKSGDSFRVFYVYRVGGDRGLDTGVCADSDFSLRGDCVVVAVRPRKVS